ncbi:hypothetical protein PoB_006079800 [Plakobranchus ocellatus]|uniref:Reverse transcriptase domain-containing protein n=1 Tax=Plakobranchus ocellatus TaxID=259542 RepID=A0AAV4CR00_9GAST|nr:hypothetical protein PoB_006079800 [Plakobranchus ocellatus]
MARNYANFFMLAASADKPMMWLRYIDDIFLIWTHGQSKLDTFIAQANHFHPSIKVTSTSSQTRILFLDVLVTISNEAVQTDL